MRRRKVDDREFSACRAEGRSGRRRLSRIAGEPHLAGEQYLCWVPANVGTVLVQHVPRLAELLARPAVEVPVLSEAGRCSQRPFVAAAADTDRRMWLLQRLGTAPGVGQLVVAALDRGGFTAKAAR